jgi:G3E family GTPase
MSASSSPIPVNLLTGFLGAGKTTLLQRLLAHPALSRAAVLINEFGEIGLDHHLIEKIDETVVLLKSGCVCCTIRGELSSAIRSLYSLRETKQITLFDRLLIETTGLADPFPILATIRADPVLSHHFKLGNVITVVDAINGAGQIKHYTESVRQIATADRLVITKSDLTSRNKVESLAAELARINPTAELMDVHVADLSVEWLLQESESSLALAQHSAAVDHNHSLEDPGRRNPHGSSIRAFALTVDSPVDWTMFGIWLTMLLSRHGQHILRVKGILSLLNEARPVAVHSVQHLVHPPIHLKQWPSVDRCSRLVFIVDGLAEARIRESLAVFESLARKSSLQPV